MPAIAVNSISITNPAPPAPPPGAVFAVSTVFAGGEPVATVGGTTIVAPHGNPKVSPACQADPLIITGIPNVFVDGKPVAVVGSKVACGHLIATGIPNVIVGGTIG